MQRLISSGPAPKQVVYKDGKVRIFEPKINQVTERDVSKNKSDVEAFLSLGFGARGDDLLRDYEVKMAGWELVDGVKTAKLELIAKNEKLRQTYNKIVLWVDPQQDVLLQQQFFEPSGDYRMAHYTNMKLNAEAHRRCLSSENQRKHQDHHAAIRKKVNGGNRAGGVKSSKRGRDKGKTKHAAPVPQTFLIASRLYSVRGRGSI